MLFSLSQTFHVTSISLRWKAFVTENSLKESKKSKSGKHIPIFLERGSIHKTFSEFQVNLFSFCILFIPGIWQLSDSQSSSWTEYVGSSSLNKREIFIVKWPQQKQEQQKAFLFLKFQLKINKYINKREEIDLILEKRGYLSRCIYKWWDPSWWVLSARLSETL